MWRHIKASVTRSNTKHICPSESKWSFGTIVIVVMLQVTVVLARKRSKIVAIVVASRVCAQMLRVCPDVACVPRCRVCAQMSRVCPDVMCVPSCCVCAQLSHVCPDVACVPRCRVCTQISLVFPDVACVPRCRLCAQLCIKICCRAQAAGQSSDSGKK